MQNIQIIDQSPAITIKLGARFTELDERALQDALNAISTSRRLIIDMSDTEHVDSAGMGVLLRLIGKFPAESAVTIKHCRVLTEHMRRRARAEQARQAA